MRRSRAVTITALVASAAMVFAACSSNPGSGTTPTSPAGGGATTPAQSPTGSPTGTATSPTTGGGSGTAPNNDTIKYAYEQEWYSYNAGTSSGNATANAVPLNQVLSGFTFMDPKSNQIVNKDFGTIEKVSEKPLTVKYTLNPKAVWSDGVKVGCADFLLNWVANAGWYYSDGSKVADPLNPDPNKTLLFDTASTTGFNQTELPKCKDGDQTFTLVYKTPFVDWKMLVGSMMPAHVAAKQGGMTTEQLVSNIESGNAKALIPVAKFWNKGWDLDKDKGLPAASLIPADGPYYVAAWQPGQSVTLKANPKWWGTPAKTGTVVIRFIAQEQQVQALQNGDVDIIGPQPTPDITAAIKALGKQVNAEFYDAFTYEHFDLSVKNAFKNKDLREALFKCAPRQQIVDNLIKPANPNAEVLNSLMWMPFQPEYANVTKVNGFSAYDKPDIAGAKAAFQASGAKPKLKIRVIHITPNQRRDNEVALLKASCDPVGFDIENTPLDSNHFGTELSSGNYDIALFAWAGSGLFGAIAALYTSTGTQNYSGWKGDTALDTALNTVNTTLDPTKIPPLLAIADTQIAKNMWSLPIFAFPSVTAFRPDIEGVQGTPIQTGDTWNMQNWVRKTS